MAEQDISPEQFAKAFERTVEWAGATSERRASDFAPLLKEHFGAEPAAFPITTEELASYERPNLQLALDAFLAERSAELVGVSAHEGMDVSLAMLVQEQVWHVRLGAVQRTIVSLDAGRSLSCVVSGLYLVKGAEGPLAIHLSGSRNPFGGSGIRVDVMASTREVSEAAVAELRSLIELHNVFRGKVISLGGGGGDFDEGGFSVRFVEVPEIEREDIVLPEQVLDTLELHTVVFEEHQARLAEGGRHIRRGLLLHGPPGTGKTLTAMHLVRRLPGRTTIILSGGGLGLIGPACSMARALAPALVILEDIDLVAHERTYFAGGASSLLFELLNQMDGIGEDADVIFLMTTNRANLLEPALAARPGRVDQAVEFPIPDAGARRKLLELFGRGLDVRVADDGFIVDGTEGTSPAFMRELVRKAALYAARDGDAHVSDEHFRRALEQLEVGGSLTRTVLGADPDAIERLGQGEGGWAVTNYDDDFDEDAGGGGANIR